LYNYRLLESSVIFKTLYSFITFGVTFDGESALVVAICTAVIEEWVTGYYEIPNM